MTQQKEEQHQPRHQYIVQERGRCAWDNIKEVKQTDTSDDKKLEKEYRSLARGLNAMIQINGLGQTLAFLKAKGKKDSKSSYSLLLKHLTEWMRNPQHFKAPNAALISNGHDGLLTWIIDKNTTSADYRRATTECLAFGAWLRRFAEAELKEPDTGA